MQKMRKAGKNPDLRIFSRTIMFSILFLHKKACAAYATGFTHMCHTL